MTLKHWFVSWSIDRMSPAGPLHRIAKKWENRHPCTGMEGVGSLNVPMGSIPYKWDVNFSKIITC